MKCEMGREGALIEVGEQLPIQLMLAETAICVSGI